MKEAVLEVLSQYQNSDGGFGHALEPNLRPPLSSVYTTSQGLYILREVGTTGSDAVVRPAIEHLINTYVPEQKIWPIIPREALDTPHAGHWDAIIGRAFEGFPLIFGPGLPDIFGTMLISCHRNSCQT